MHSIVLLDLKIDKDEALALLDEYGAFIKKHTDVDCTWNVERRDFSVVPTVADSDGDLKPTRDYRKALETDVHKRYGTYGTDNIIMLVHEDNFLFKGVWGVNWSGNFYKYSMQLCRWDKDNTANSFGTLYHEMMHSFDWVINEELGKNINTEYHGSWDKHVVHGGRPDQAGKHGYDYIRYQENTNELRKIGLRLNQAYQKRRDRQKLPLLKKIVELLSTLLRLRLGKK